MGELYGSLRELCQRLWRPWSASRSDRDSADAVALAVFAIWLSCVPITVWMAAGDPPWSLALLAVAVLWVLGSLYFFILGLAPLAVPVFRIWQAVPQNRDKSDELPDPSDEWEANYEDRVKWTEKMKNKGVLREDYELPPKERGDFQDTLNRATPDRPQMRLAVKIAGVILIVALIVSDQPLLATFYAFPSLGWLALEGLERLLLRRRRA